jgi:hypothetical protein
MFPMTEVFATERQVAFINSLASERVVPEGLAESLKRGAQFFSRADASNVIETLLSAPRAERVAFADTPERVEARELLAGLPKSKYAIPAFHLEGVLSDYRLDGELLFVEIREYRGVRYLRRLTGSVGDFTRSRLTVRDALAVLRVLEGGAREYIRKFGEHFVCCGKCGAPLTDDKSRARFLGPDCARQLGML